LSERNRFFDLPNLIVISIWFVALYLIFFMSRYGWSVMVLMRASIVVCLISGSITWYVLKRKGGFSRTDKNEKLMPAVGEIENIEKEIQGSEFVSEITYRKITWVTTIGGIVMFSIFLEYITYRSDYRIALISLLIGIIISSIPLFVNVKDDMENIMERAERERQKAWRKGKVKPPNGET
tara:strand:+ start:476 stop:1015 length:540 start_codon:yes stop_codon:yes gene_type:complete